MRNIEVSYQQAWGSVYMVIRAENPQLLDGYSIHTIQQKSPEFLLPVTVSNENNATVLMYKIMEQTDNIRFMDASVTGQQAAAILLNMLGILIHLINWNLDYHKVCFDARCIYVNKENGKVYYTYIPMSDYTVSDMEIKQYLYGIVKSFVVTDEPGVVERMLSCFTDEVTLEELYQRVSGVYHGGSSVGNPPHVNTPSVNTAPVQPQAPAFYLELVQSEMPGVPRRISLDFQGNGIVIGRTSQSEEKPDVAFPSECKGIGRKHARIEYQAGTYYLVDLNSVNHTFLNGQQLAPNQPYALCPGCEITFTKVKPVRYRMVREG